MKRLLLFLFFLVVCLNLSFAYPYEYQTEVDGIIYKLDETDKKALLCGFNSSLPPNVEIPSEIIYKEGSYKVSVIGNYAFYDCTLLESIVISEGVKVIGEAAFQKCSSLKSIEIPNSVTSIMDFAFCDCSSLKSIEIPNSVKSIGVGAFEGCTSLDSINIPNSVTIIRSDTFFGCESLKNLVIDNGENELIFLHKLYSCPIENLYLGRDILFKNVYIDGGYYGDCLSPFNSLFTLKKIIIGPKVSFLSDGLFKSCSSLKEFFVSDGNNDLILEEKTIFSGMPIEEVYLGRKLIVPDDAPIFRKLSELSKVTIKCCIDKVPDSYFSACKSLKYVELPEGIREIGDAAFYETGLRTIDLPDSLSKIGSSAFEYCPLDSIKIPDKVIEIGDDAFRECKRMKSITFPGELTKIGHGAFYNCTSLSDVTFEDGPGKVSIDNTWEPRCFDECPIQKLYLGRTIANNSLFNYTNCNFLSKVTIGNCVTDLNSSFFAICPNIKEISIERNHNLSFSSNVYENADLIIKDNKEFATNFPKTGWGQFNNVLYEENSDSYFPIIWSNGLECPEAYYSSDSGCLVSKDLEKVGIFRDREESLPILFRGQNVTDSIKSDKEFSFKPVREWKQNQFFVFSNDNTNSIRNVTVEKAGELFNVIGMNDLQSIESLSVKGELNGTDILTINRMTALKHLNLIDANIVSGGKAYSGNYKTHDNVWGSYFFSSMKNLLTVLLPRTVKKIENNTFNTSINNIVIPEGVEIILNSFENCTSLRVINIPDGVIQIGSSAFNGCTSLVSVHIGEGITQLGDNMFYNCSSLSSIHIPNSVTSMGKNIFKDCTSLTSVIISSGLRDVSETIFTGCKSLTIAIFSDSEEGLSINVDGSLFFKDCPLKKLYLGRGISSNYNKSPFYGKDQLIEVEIGPLCKYIGPEAFAYCRSLSSIDVPNSVKQIYRDAFVGCSSLTSIEIPNSVENIGDNAFSYCTSLNSLKLSDSLTKISQGLCNGCSSITSIEIPEKVATIEYYAFNRCTSLQTIKLPDSLQSIEQSAFTGCTSLESINFPGNLKIISQVAFSDCASLGSIILPKSLNNIEPSAFLNCTSLSEIKSLNPTPPGIYKTTFDGVDKKNCKLIVTKGNLVNYWLDLYWKDFMNISDDMLALDPIPDARYGDASVDLAKYSPEGVKFMYESSNNNVARIDGTKLTICGAGEASVSASLEEEGTPMEIIGQIRTFKVDKADLTLTARSYEITQGDLIPDFLIDFTGFVYDDDSSCIEELPEIVCSALDSSLDGEYEISLIGGKDSNYNMGLVPGTLVIKKQSGIHPDMNEQFSCKLEDGNFIIKGLNHDMPVSIYDVNGLLLFQKQASEEGTIIFHPEKQGIYIVTTGFTTFKIIL